MRKPQGPRILVFDIETSPLTSYTWGCFDQTVGLSQIKEDWCILSVSWKWLGDAKVGYIDNRGDPKNDAAVVAMLWTLFDEADILVGQNSIKFDVRKANARFLHYGYLPPSPYKCIDTMRQAKRIAMMTSNKLEYLSAELTDVPKSKHKDFPGFELWLGVLADNPQAWKAMKEYNEVDVLATEKVYLRLRPWDKQHPSLAQYHEDTGMENCPRCNSTELTKQGFKVTTAGRYQQYKCNGCGGWSTSRFTQNTQEQRRRLLTSA